jgi:hypothetical protein
VGKLAAVALLDRSNLLEGVWTPVVEASGRKRCPSLLLDAPCS